MNVDIKSEKQTPLPRTEYELEVTHEGTTPSRLDVKQKAGLHIDGDNDKLIIRNYPSTYNGKTFTVIARQYHDEDAMHHLEYKAMVQKNTISDNDDETDEDES